MKNNQLEKLSDYADYSKAKISIAEIDTKCYFSKENMLPNKGGVTEAAGLPTQDNVTKVLPENVLVSNIRPYFKKIYFANELAGASNDVLCFVAKNGCLPRYLYYLLSSDSFFDYMMAGAKGTKMPRGDKGQIMNFPVWVPAQNEQSRIVSVLSALDEKIENISKINHNLEEQAKAIFKSWFVDFSALEVQEFFDNNGVLVPEGWDVSCLTNIADYLNGLAMQKYRPDDGDVGYPVLKIKELRQGMCDRDSERCSTISVKPEYIVHDGDVIFSWSGSLLVDFWCGGDCGLNQHLFKVTSTKFDKWFYYSWTLHHLNEFIAIAADKATTMGHIKRENLQAAAVLIPPEKIYNEIGKLLGPIYESIVRNRVESKRLAQLRDALLPKLMSGEIDVSEVEI